MTNRRSPVRAVLVLEAATTLLAAGLAFAAPERLLDLTAPVDLDDVGRAVTAQVGAAWLVLGSLLVGCLRFGPGDARPLRLVLAAVLIGDVAHVVAVGALLAAAGAGVPAGAVAQLLFIVALAANRGLALARPALVLGP